MLGAWIEHQVHRMIPDNQDMTLISTITLLFSGTAILAGLFLIAVMFGIHQGFVPVYFALMDAQGFNSLFPILAMAGAGQAGGRSVCPLTDRLAPACTNQRRDYSRPAGDWRTAYLRCGATAPQAVHHCLHRRWDRWVFHRASGLAEANCRVKYGVWPLGVGVDCADDFPPGDFRRRDCYCLYSRKFTPRL